MSAPFLLLVASAVPIFNLTLNTSSDVNLESFALANGWNGSDRLRVTIPSGQTISASLATNYALEVSGTFPGGVDVINQGTINGKGGAGGAGGTNNGNGSQGSIGGNALGVDVPCTFDNQGTINAGSGGQGGGAAVRTGYVSGTTNAGCTGQISCIGASCNNGFCYTNVGPTGAVGGSTGSTGLTGSAGSSAAYGTNYVCTSLSGCSGSGCTKRVTCATGSPGPGGLAGKSVVGNSFITWINTGTRNGAVT